MNGDSEFLIDLKTLSLRWERDWEKVKLGKFAQSPTWKFSSDASSQKTKMFSTRWATSLEQCSSRTSQNAPQVTSCLSLSLAQQNYDEGPPKELLSEETLDFIANDIMPAFKAMLEDEELREVILSHF